MPNKVNHVVSGIGTFESRTGIYIGSWKSGLQEGNGTAIYNNGNRYDGKEFFIGQCFAFWLYSFIFVYLGEFHNGFKHGYGKFTVTTNNDVYTGTFDRGVRHGEVGI